MDDEIKIEKTIEEAMLNKLAGASVGNFGESTTYLLQLFNQLRAIIGKEKLKELVGEEKYKIIVDIINERMINVTVCESYRSLVGNFTRQDEINSQAFQEYQRSLSKLPLIDYWLWFAIIKIIKATSLRYVPGIEQKYYEFSRVKEFKLEGDREIGRD